jgi:anti-sigma regulatory factor (Ser/Thr protein kinase)
VLTPCASAEREADAAGPAARIDPRLIAFMLPAIPESVRIARFHVRTALGFRGLGQYADAAIITSELVTNAVQHACRDVTETVGVTLARASDSEAVIITVSDSAPHGPAIREASAGSERGLGLQIVESLSARWGWHPEPGGKAVFAILAGGRAHDGGTATPHRSAPGSQGRHRRGEHPRAAPPQRVDPGRAR